MFVYILIWEIDYHKKLLGIFCQFCHRNLFPDFKNENKNVKTFLKNEKIHYSKEKFGISEENLSFQTLMKWKETSKKHTKNKF